MVKFRFGLFETNSSSVHTLAMCRSYHKISDEDYEKSKTNIIDLSCNELDGSFRLFSEKIQKLYTFLNDNELNILDNFLENYESDSEYIFVTDVYRKNIEINGIKFRDFYKNLKKNLFEVIEEIIGKKPEIINEDYFECSSHDLSGFIPVEKEYIKEVLLNKDIRIVFEDNFGCDEEDEYLSIDEEELKSKINKRKKKLEKNMTNTEFIECLEKTLNSNTTVCERCISKDSIKDINKSSKNVYIIIDEKLNVKKLFYSKPTLECIVYELNIKEPSDFIEASKAIYEGNETFKVNGVIYKIIILEV